MPWADNIAKTMTSNGKQFTVTREMLTAVAPWSERAVEDDLMSSQEPQRVFQNLVLFCFVLLFNKSINELSFGKQ